jgi:hypothetical protein
MLNEFSCLEDFSLYVGILNTIYIHLSLNWWLV